MKKALPFFVFVAVLMVSCGNNSATQNTDTATDVVITRKEISSEVIKTVANLSIEGMSCSAGCGGKIQQDLRALKGVKTTTLDYEDNRSLNFITVEYNPEELPEQDFIKCVNEVGDGRYHIKAMEIITYKGLQSSGGNSATSVNTDNLNKVIQVFNLLQSISKLAEYSR